MVFNFILMMTLVLISGVIVQTAVNIFSMLIYLKAFVGNEIYGSAKKGWQ